MKSRWKQFRRRLEYLGMRLLASAVPRLPRRVCLRLAHAMGELYYRLDARTRHIALENLRVCFGDTYTPAQREQIARASYRNFGRTMLDLFWARNLTPENYQQYMKPVGFEAARALREKHGGVIFVALHRGIYEWLCMPSAFDGLPVWIVAMDFKNSALESVFGTARSRGGNHIIQRQNSMLRMLRAVKRNGGVGILIDLALSLEHPGEVIEAFGMKIHVTFLHQLLHERTGAPIIPLSNIPHPDGTCTITAHAPLTFPPGATRQEIVQACWDYFEPSIRERPDLWLWSYRHFRFRPKDAALEYPAYAHGSAKFERVLTQKMADAADANAAG